MKIVNTGIKYQIYDDSLRTFDSLPAATYCVRFSKLSGFYLESRPNMQVNETVYGPHESKVEKVIASYNAFPRSLGVILSGAKGIGKSMFARLLSTRAISAGLPVLIVDEAIPGIASYLESIDQEVMILFDEFDKTFAHPSDNDKTDPQSTMLSLFDGASNGKRLFVVTCNDLKGLNDFLVNRPGRFHYHFRFDYPTADEIRTYMQDKLKPEYYDQIDAVIGFAGRVDLNYDCLRSIAFELNTGLPFTEAIKDLNIVNLNAERYNITMKFANGVVYTTSNVHRWLSSFGEGYTSAKDDSPLDLYCSPSAGIRLQVTGPYFYLTETHPGTELLFTNNESHRNFLAQACTLAHRDMSRDRALQLLSRTKPDCKLWQILRAHCLPLAQSAHDFTQ